jgi:DNA polymerase III delta prime subunit
MKSTDHFLFTEKYRPGKIEDCILPDRIKNTLSQIVSQGEIPNLLFEGSAGCGKTTAARAIVSTLNCDYLFINASEDSGIDTLRTTIREFASKMSISGNGKIVILDEADYLTHNTQNALRGFMEEFSKNCRFILTCNYSNKIVEALHSRTTNINFVPDDSEMPSLMGLFMGRIMTILDDNKISYDKKVIAEVIKKYFKNGPDYRRVLNKIQEYSVGGSIDEGILSQQKDSDVTELVGLLKKKEFVKVREWVGKNISSGSVQIMDRLYETMKDHIKPESYPLLIPILAEFQYKAAFVSNQELNLMACLTYIMSDVSFK